MKIIHITEDDGMLIVLMRSGEWQAATGLETYPKEGERAEAIDRNALEKRLLNAANQILVHLKKV